MLPTKDIMFSLICLIAFKQLDDENAKSMYSWLNVLVNEINSLGVKQIEDLELIRKILHSLRRPDYDLMITILYEKAKSATFFTNT